MWSCEETNRCRVTFEIENENENEFATFGLKSWRPCVITHPRPIRQHFIIQILPIWMQDDRTDIDFGGVLCVYQLNPSLFPKDKKEFGMWLTKKPLNTNT